MAPRKEPQFTPERPAIFTRENIAVSLSLVISVVLGAIGVTSVVLNRLNSIDNRIFSMEQKLNRVWTTERQRQYSYELQWSLQREFKNDFKAPDADDIARRLP